MLVHLSALPGLLQRLRAFPPLDRLVTHRLLQRREHDRVPLDVSYLGAGRRRVKFMRKFSTMKTVLS